MLCPLELQRLNGVSEIVDMHIHVISARGKQPGVMGRESHLFGRIAVMGEYIKRFGKISEIPKSDSLICGSSDYLLIVLMEV